MEVPCPAAIDPPDSELQRKEIPGPLEEKLASIVIQESSLLHAIGT